MQITRDVWDIILDFVTNHSELISGNFFGPESTGNGKIELTMSRILKKATK